MGKENAMSDAVRLSIILRTAIQDGLWNPTDWGRTLLSNMEKGMRVPADGPDELAMRNAMVGVFASDLMVHLHGEVADGLMPASVLDGRTTSAPPRAAEAAPGRLAA